MPHSIYRPALERPIEPNVSAYRRAVESFGKAEVKSGVLDTIVTIAAAELAKRTAFPSLLVPFAGPAVEKMQFLFHASMEAREENLKLPPHQRLDKESLAKKVWRDARGLILKDIMFHDPIHAGSIAAGMYFAPEVHPGVWSALGFTAGVFIAAGLDVANQERVYRGFPGRLAKVNILTEEPYIEAHYHAPTAVPTRDIVKLLSRPPFNLVHTGDIHYSDRYFPLKLPALNGRSAKFRIRDRGVRKHERPTFALDKRYHSAQLIFTRHREDEPWHGKPDQVRYFASEKRKSYGILESGVRRLENISDERMRHFVLGIADRDTSPYDIEFDRITMRNENLMACIDRLEGFERKTHYVIELKVWNRPENLPLLQRAMRQLQVGSGVHLELMTLGKADLFEPTTSSQ